MYTLIYRMTFTTQEGQLVIIHVSDTTTATTSTPSFHDLSLVECEKKIVSDGDSRYGVKSTRLEFSFMSTSTVSLKTFATGDDGRWLVEMFFTDLTQLKFTGFLVMDDLREKYLLPGVFSCELTATDNLGLLRDTPLTKPDGTNPRGYFTWIEYISWALQKTGLQLPIRTIYNLFPEGYNPVSHQTFSVSYLHAKTFESDINISVDCHAAINKLIKGCVLVQHDGAWWILRMDEMNGTSYIYASFSYDGVFIANGGATMLKNIGLAETIKITGDGADVLPERRKLFVQERFSFQFPREIIDNYDFSRGVTYLSPIVVGLGLFIKSYANLGAFPTTGEFDITYKANDTGLYYKWAPGYVLKSTVPFGKAYVFDDWTLEKVGGGSPTISAYIAKIYDPEEIQRYAVLSGGGGSHRVKSNKAPLSRNDKINFSIDRRLNSNQSGAGSATEDFAAVRLMGEDGTYWNLTNVASGSERVGQWIQSNASFSTNQRFIRTTYNINDTDETKWMSLSVESEPLPVNGDVEVSFYQSTVFGTAVETHFSNMHFDVIFYVNGSYQKYSGFSYKVSQAGNLRAKIEDTIEIADTPKKLLLGTIFTDSSGVKIPTSTWYNANAGTSGELGLAPWGKYQAFAEWNQNNRIMRRIEGNLFHYRITFGIPSILHLYRFTDPSEHTDNKYFCMVSCSQNLVSDEWSGVFYEVYDSSIGKLFSSTYEFKYLT
jgi:hypothetical protein